ncbi:AraC family transcriptional regulator [Flavobacterium paronense]|uniref:Helix-turn-helix domain-containing protein n=1 Tax=Flavobacterium paronense TaxID=1392775 RepID=A0ABV5GHJ5_9FLAO|nr:AraC family transcriptional regulator [Flavobacterium paronense]MDN3676427.1 AraC family transcriptional regulator [Flavobacterium paronense]
MTEIQLLNSISRIVVFLLLFFSFFLLTVRGNKKKSNQLFSVFLLLVAIDISAFFLNDWLSKHLFIETFRITSSLLQMPVFYFYVLSVCYTNFKLRINDLIHTLLFIFFYSFLIASDYSKKAFLVFQIISEIQYFLYIILIFIALKKYKKIYLENYTNPEHLNYKWLVQMTSILLFAHLFVLSKFFIQFTNNINLILLLNVIVIISALLVSSYFVLKALHQPQLFSGIEQNNTPISKYIKKETKIITSEITSENNEKIKLLEQFMTEKEPFLDPDLTIQKLALQIDFSQKELSTLINHHIGKHFFDFINEYRVLKAMSILKNQSQKDITVLEILYQVGFNSKSSFNTAFKKHSPMTPIEYRKQFLSNK